MWTCCGRWRRGGKADRQLTTPLRTSVVFACETAEGSKARVRDLSDGSFLRVWYAFRGVTCSKRAGSFHPRIGGRRLICRFNRSLCVPFFHRLQMARPWPSLLRHSGPWMCYYGDRLDREQHYLNAICFSRYGIARTMLFGRLDNCLASASHPNRDIAIGCLDRQIFVCSGGTWAGTLAAGPSISRPLSPVHRP